jgi:UDP-N-acetylmuramoylalanine--D-glutamate ligase
VGESGTGAALLAHKMGISVFVSEKNSIAEKYKLELAQRNIPFEEGGHTEEIVLKAAEIVKSPGIPHKVDMIQKSNREKYSCVK